VPAPPAPPVPAGNLQEKVSFTANSSSLASINIEHIKNKIKRAIIANSIVRLEKRDETKLKDEVRIQSQDSDSARDFAA
jgi:hypothetical protein